jgi:antitoxin VapB
VTPSTAKLFRNGRSQAVRLPKEFSFEGTGEVFVRRNEVGEVILSRKPSGWEDFLAALSKQAPGDNFELVRDTRSAPNRVRFRG